MSSHWKAIFGVILIFVLGFASGVVSSGIFAQRKMAEFLRHPGIALMAAMERRLTRGLDLDPNQKAQIHGYFMDNLRQHKLLQTQIQPQVAQLNAATVQQIRATLRPDQLQRFNQNIDDLRNRFWKYAASQDPGNSSQQPAGASTNSGTASPPAPQ